MFRNIEFIVICFEKSANFVDDISLFLKRALYRYIEKCSVEDKIFEIFLYSIIVNVYS